MLIDCEVLVIHKDTGQPVPQKMAVDPSHVTNEPRSSHVNTESGKQYVTVHVKENGVVNILTMVRDEHFLSLVGKVLKQRLPDHFKPVLRHTPPTSRGKLLPPQNILVNLNHIQFVEPYDKKSTIPLVRLNMVTGESLVVHGTVMDFLEPDLAH